MKIEIWITPDGIAYTEPMLCQKALEYAKDFEPRFQAEAMVKAFNAWIKNYDHQTLWV